MESAFVPKQDATLNDERWKQLIKRKLEIIGEKNEFYKGIKHLREKGKRERVSKNCVDLRTKFYDDWMKINTSDPDEGGDPDTSDAIAESERTENLAKIKEQEAQLAQQCLNKLYEYLESELGFKLENDPRKFRQELGDYLFYVICKVSEDYPQLRKNEQPYEPIQIIIDSLYLVIRDELFLDFEEKVHAEHYQWFELCCVMLENKDVFEQFYKNLNNNADALEYFLKKHPQLLFNKYSDLVIFRLMRYLPYERLYQLLEGLTDSRGQTQLFYVGIRYNPHVKLFAGHCEDLYKLVSLSNEEGQTTVHYNIQAITTLLAGTYTPKHRQSFLRLLAFRDKNNKTAVNVASEQGFQDLPALKVRVVDNKYVTSTSDTKIIVIYNDRPTEAQEDSQTLISVCQTKYDKRNVTVIKNKTKTEIIQGIEEVANMRNKHDVPFKALIVFIVTLGSIGATISDRDGKRIMLSKIEEAMCSDILKELPKVLIACQYVNSDTTQEQDVDEEQIYVPIHDHFCYMTSLGCGDRRSFLKNVAKHINNSTRDTNFPTIFNNICAAMWREELLSPTPIMMSTLRAQYCPADDWYILRR